MVSRLLAADAAHEVVLADASEDALDQSAASVEKVIADPSRPDTIDRVLSGFDVAIAAGASHTCLPLAKAALRRGCHYLDFNESAASAREILALPPSEVCALIPGCGLSPGLLSALISDFVGDLQGDLDLSVYVGALPRQKLNRLGYGLIMSIDGLLKEYFDPASIKVDGEWRTVDPLTLEERITIGGVPYEAFTTGGIANELPTAVGSRVRNYVYRTLRFPGHLEFMRLLLDDLKLRQRRDMLGNLLRNGLPTVEDDQVILRIVARVDGNGRCEEEHGKTWTITRLEGQGENRPGVLYEIAARHAAAIVDLVTTGALAGHGNIHQQDIPARMLLANRHLKGMFHG